MEKIKVGITGQSGFIGSHLFRTVKVSEDLEAVEFSREFFDDPARMRDFCARCDAVVHFAGLSRHPDGWYLYDVNLGLTEKLTAAARPGQCLMLGSTTHEKRDTPYHASKRAAREAIEAWAAVQGGRSRTLLMANAFGPGSRPFYNSVVSTFCAMAARGQVPAVIDRVQLELIDVGTLCRAILAEIRNTDPARAVAEIPARHLVMLPELWEKLSRWSKLEPDAPPKFEAAFDALLWNAFRSYR